jgi:hypothetical protein
MEKYNPYGLIMSIVLTDFETIPFSIVPQQKEKKTKKVY